MLEKISEDMPDTEIYARYMPETTGARWNEMNWRVSWASVSRKTLLQTKQCCDS